MCCCGLYCSLLFSPAHIKDVSDVVVNRTQYINILFPVNYFVPPIRRSVSLSGTLNFAAVIRYGSSQSPVTRVLGSQIGLLIRDSPIHGQTYQIGPVKPAIGKS